MNINTFLHSKADANLASLPAATTSRYRYWQVEGLLNASADLLDRCLAEQARYDALRAQAATAYFSLRAESDSVHIDELKRLKGIDKFDAVDSARRAELLRAMTTSMNQARDELGAQFATNYSNRGAAAAIHIQEVSRARWEIDLDAAETDSGRQQETGSVDPTDPNLGLLTLRHYLVEQARVRVDEKTNAMSDGLALDFTGQALRSRLRIEKDYIYATERLLAASEGLRLLFGYDVPYVPQKPSPNTQGTIIDSTAQWTSDAINWLARFGQLDQTITVAFSVRKLVGAQWEALRQSQEVTFKLTEGDFEKLSYVRMRGIVASARWSNLDARAPIDCVLTLPRKANVRITAEDGALIRWEEIDQKNVPSCVLGRVDSISSPREVELCGAVSLMNTSPIGASSDPLWTLRVISISDEDLSHLDDIYLELRISARSLK